MEEIYEFRLPKKRAKRLFGSSVGVPVGGDVCKIVVNKEDPIFYIICDFSRENDGLFYSWSCSRKYTIYEIENAKYFHVWIKAFINTSGRECGTIYDDSNECKYCGANCRKEGDLILQLSKIPKMSDIARTISDEWIISDRFKVLLENLNANGFILEKIKPFKQSTKEENNWHYLIITSKPVEIHENTIYGINPFDLDNKEEYVCPLGHVKGLNILSELFIKKEKLFCHDFMITKQLWGVKRGLLRPVPSLIVSKRIYNLYKNNKLKGCSFEIAHFR